MTMEQMGTSDHDLVPPSAGPMIEAMRAHGYSPATAVADIIDNSISAGAKTVWLNFRWAGAHTHVSILDDGCGMDEDTLRNAMRLGSKSPLEDRGPGDLGRFGLGLKTASFSQCRRLTVASLRKGTRPSLRCWDLDKLENEWRLLKTAAPSSSEALKDLDQLDHGTIVLWEVVDRMVGKGTSEADRAAHDRFCHLIQDVEEYLAMVFHRYLEGSLPQLRVFLNGTDADHLVRPWDPFLEAHLVTFKTPVESIPHPNGEVRIQGFVLPHKDKLGPDDSNRAAGHGGWNAQQGFYVYRNRRMLVGGGWLGIGSDRPWTQEEQYRLARVLVDIPNSQDFDWQIDVKKSTAKPPAWLRDRLKVLAERVRKQAREVFVHRGKYGPRADRVEITRAWLPKSTDGRPSYRIDRKHPLVSAVSRLALTLEQKKLVEALLRTLEETLPVAQIWLDSAERQDSHHLPFETADDIEKRRLVEIAFRVLREQEGLKADVARDRLRHMEGFQDLAHIIDTQQD